MEQNSSLFFGKTISAKVADQLRNDILSRRIEPGSRITAKEIAEKYGISSVPVREAFSMLYGEGLLELSPYKGAVVKVLAPEYVAQMLELSMALETLLVELCMQKGYPEPLLRQLDGINEEMAMLKDDEKAWRENRLSLNIRFHTLEFSLCRDHLAYELYEKNLQRISTIRQYYAVDAVRGKQSLQEHREIVDALRRKDLQAALDVTRRHSDNSKKSAIIQVFE